MAIVKFTPLDKEGVRYDRPASEVQWQKLTNVVFKDGSIVPRPGFQPVYNMSAYDTDGLSLEFKNLVYIGQIRNPGSSISGREGYTVVTETVRPDASSDLVAGWTGDHTDIDETPPNGTDFLETSTGGATKSIGFAAMSNTYAIIFGTVLRGRAKVDTENAVATLGFYIYDSGTLYKFGEVVVTGNDSEADQWQEFALSLGAYPENHPSACQPFDDDTLDALTIAVKLEDSSVDEVTVFAPSANGTYSEWKDYSDGGTAVYTDIEGVYGVIGINNTPSSSYHRMVPANAGVDGADKKQSFKFNVSGITYNSISQVEFAGYVTKGPMAQPNFDLYWRSAAGDETLVGNVEGKVGSNYVALDFTMDTNPDTAGAWTQAALNAGEFFIRCGLGGIGTPLTHVGLRVRGVSDASTEVKVDYLALDVMGATTSTPGTGLIDFTRLFSYQNSHLRLDNDGLNVISLTDVTNSVALSTAPGNIPVDHAVLFGQVYLVNGRDATRIYPNASNLYTSLTTNNADGATKITGRTVCAHGNRILYGWVTDNTSVTPERIAYSKFNDGSTHNHVSAGDFDLLDTPGGVVKLIPLNEDVVAGLKERGVYNIIKTGMAAFPYRRDLIDSETGCLAKMSAKQIVLKDGRPAIVFLGENASEGVNVFLFDGSSVVAVGNPIRRKLEEDTNPQVLEFAFAEVDPISGSYWLWVAEGCDRLIPTAAWVMDINSLSWTRAEFPFEISCAGEWNLLPEATQTTGSGQRYLRGKRNMVLGTSGLLPSNAVHNTPYDVTESGLRPTAPFGDTDGGPQRRVAFTSTLESGDFVRPSDVQVASYRLHMELTVLAYTLRVVVSSSEDGGETYNTEQEYLIGPSIIQDSGDDLDFTLGKKQYFYMDLTPSNANIVRYKIAIGPDDAVDLNTVAPFTSPWKIDDLRVELIGTGVGA